MSCQSIHNQYMFYSCNICSILNIYLAVLHCLLNMHYFCSYGNFLLLNIIMQVFNHQCMSFRCYCAKVIRKLPGHFALVSKSSRQWEGQRVKGLGRKWARERIGKLILADLLLGVNWPGSEKAVNPLNCTLSQTGSVLGAGPSAAVMGARRIFPIIIIIIIIIGGSAAPYSTRMYIKN